MTRRRHALGTRLPSAQRKRKYPDADADAIRRYRRNTNLSAIFLRAHAS